MHSRNKDCYERKKISGSAGHFHSQMSDRTAYFGTSLFFVW